MTVICNPSTTKDQGRGLQPAQDQPEPHNALHTTNGYRGRALAQVFKRKENKNKRRKISWVL